MKPLLFTFFAIVLCYSLFFDSEAGLPAVDELNYIHESASPAVYMAKDTLGSYTYTYSVGNGKGNGWSLCTADEETKIPFSY
jgi:hypothetical protein